MAYTNIDLPTDYFNTVLYTGTGATLSITGVGFQPDFVWIKQRSGTRYHRTIDSVRGVNNELYPNGTDAESAEVSSLTSFNSDGFTIGSSAGVNENTYTFASWNWKANGAGVSNTEGSINSTVSASTTSGFSIVSWTGDGTNATVGHGLSQAPTIYIVKNRTDVTDWRVGQVLTSSNNMTDGNGYYMELNDTKASTNPGSAVTWGSPPTAPTSSVFTVGSNNAHNGSGDAMIAYCFHSVKGFSKFGSYTGNGSADGPFIYTGFKPAFVMFKNTSSALFWQIHDSARDPFNEVQKRLAPNSSDAEGSGSIPIDFLSNGIKLRTTATTWNESGSNLIYMAFAENPFVTSSGVPATAR
jgi:hypothetical protein